MAKINENFMDGYKGVVDLVADAPELPMEWFANEINYDAKEFEYWLNENHLELAEWYRGRVAALTNLQALATIEIVGVSEG